MTLKRREFLAAAIAVAGAPFSLPPDLTPMPAPTATRYGLIGKMTATPGQRDALAAILMEGTQGMPGCLSYIVAADPAEPDALWITEAWDSQASHQASLSLPSVQAAIARGRPLIAGFSHRVETVPLGGHGLAGSGAPR